MNSLIHFTCPACGKSVKTQAQQAGKRARCPSSACGHTFRIPGLMPSPADLEPLPPARVVAPTRQAFTVPPSGSRLVLPWVVAGIATFAFVTTLGLWLLDLHSPVPLARHSPLPWPNSTVPATIPTSAPVTPLPSKTVTQVQEQPTAIPTREADAQHLPQDGPGDPALTYEVVKENTAKHRGKRVTWAFVPCSSDGKRMMCALNFNDAVGPKHEGIYVVEFASEKEAADAFFAAKPGSTLTGTIAGEVDQFLVVKGPDGVTRKDIPKVTVPLLLFPKYTVAAADKGKERPGAVPPPKADTVWKQERTKNGQTVLSDGTLSVTFPANVTVEVKGSYASVSIRQETGARLEGYLSIERKDTPPEAKKAADPRQWLKDLVRDEVEKDRKAEHEGKKDYDSVKLVRTANIALGAFKGLKAITDHERALSGIKIAGGLHSICEADHYLIGDHLYILRAGGSGAPQGAPLFDDHTGFHRSELAHQFFTSVILGSADSSPDGSPLDGEWTLYKCYFVYTGAEKDSLMVSSDHKLVIKGDTLEVTGLVDGKKNTVKYKLVIDRAAKPNQFQLMNPANAEDTSSGSILVEKNKLLLRTSKFGKAGPDWGYSGIRMQLNDAGGSDADIPTGFLLKPGDRGGRVLEFSRSQPKK